MHHTIEVRNLVFKYPDGTHALDGISFSIAPGEKVALVGHSMGGLISRFAIQYNLFGAADNVARLMTMATPHGGARYASPAGLLRFLPGLRDDDIQFFTPDWVSKHMGGQVPDPPITTLGPTDIFCIGLSPKWLLQRRRLHDAVEALKAGAGTLAEVAADLGYADQAHFTHDFRTVTGMTPGEYLKDQPRDPPVRRPHG